MAELQQPDYGLAEKLAFAQAGGVPQGQRDVDKLNTAFGSLGAIPTKYNAIIKQVLENKKLNLENIQKTQETTPIADTVTTPQVKSILGQAQNSPIPAEDLASGQLNTWQKAIDNAKNVAMQGQLKYGNMTPSEYSKISAGGWRDIQGQDLQQKMNIAGKTIWYNPTTLQSTAVIPGQQPPAGFVERNLEKGLEDTTKANMMGIKQAESNLTPQELEPWAQKTYEKGMVLPENMGMAPGVRVQIMKRAAEIAAEKGDTAKSAILRQATIESGKVELNNLAKQEAAINAFSRTSETNLKNYLDSSQKIIQMLWAAYGMIQESKLKKGVLIRKTVPSGGALYSLQVILVLFSNVDRLKSGIYKIWMGASNTYRRVSPPYVFLLHLRARRLVTGTSFSRGMHGAPAALSLSLKKMK